MSSAPSNVPGYFAPDYDDTSTLFIIMTIFVVVSMSDGICMNLLTFSKFFGVVFTMNAAIFVVLFPSQWPEMWIGVLCTGVFSIIFITRHRQARIRLFALERLFLAVARAFPPKVNDAVYRVAKAETTTIFYMTLADLRLKTSGFGLRRVLTESVRSLPQATQIYIKDRQFLDVPNDALSKLITTNIFENFVPSSTGYTSLDCVRIYRLDNHVHWSYGTNKLQFYGKFGEDGLPYFQTDIVFTFVMMFGAGFRLIELGCLSTYARPFATWALGIYIQAFTMVEVIGVLQINPRSQMTPLLAYLSASLLVVPAAFSQRLTELQIFLLEKEICESRLKLSSTELSLLSPNQMLEHAERIINLNEVDFNEVLPIVIKNKSAKQKCSKFFDWLKSDYVDLTTERALTAMSSAPSDVPGYFAPDNDETSVSKD
ncbi:hypothetical protein HDU76_009682 [Blyttiomyces sp. JEL0837]|nr:hypothetical protein HDU76_009682 [Blyttiomyces sp. JEL0837]